MIFNDFSYLQVFASKILHNYFSNLAYYKNSIAMNIRKLLINILFNAQYYF